MLHSFRGRKGVTLVEMAVALGVLSIMLLVLASLLILVSRNSVLVSEQGLSQNQAAAATERITNLVRNASGIRPYGSDDISTTLTRIRFDMPVDNSTGVIAFVPPTQGRSDGVVKIFLNQAAYKPGTVNTDRADYEFRGIEKFGINYLTSTWMTVRTFYSYRSYMNFAARNNDNNSRLVGEFVTDVIAKNHHPGESANYAHTTTSLFLL